MLKKITLDNFRSFKNRVTVELTKTSYNMLSHNAADNGVLKGCIFVGANGSGKSTIIRGIKLLLDLLFSEKILDLGSFLCVFGERRQYSVEYEFIVENEVIRYSFEVDTEKELISEKLLVDDFSGAFHNDLESLLVRYFMEKSNHSQLLFVSHSTNLLSNSILRPDQEYSVEFRNEEGSSVKRFSSEQPRSA